MFDTDTKPPTLKELPVFEIYSNLVIAKVYQIDPDDLFANEAVGVLREIEDRLEIGLFNDAAIKFANEQLSLLVEKSQAKYPEIAEFLSGAVGPYPALTAAPLAAK